MSQAIYNRPIVYIYKHTDIVSSKQKKATTTLAKALLYLFLISLHFIESRDSSVGIATGYGLDDRVGQEFSLLHVIQTYPGAQPSSYPIRTEGSFPGVKRQGRETDHLPPTSAEVKRTLVYISTPPYAFMG
jgi:hypothetical protein